MGLAGRLAATVAAACAAGPGDVAPGPLRAPQPPAAPRFPGAPDPVVFGWPGPTPPDAYLGHVSCKPCGVEWRGDPACWHCGQPATY